MKSTKPLQVDLDDASKRHVTVLIGQLSALPEEIASCVCDEFARLIEHSSLDIPVAAASAAADTRDCVVGLGVARVDELFAAALRAVELKLGFHNDSPLVAAVAGASKATSGAVGEPSGSTGGAQ